LRKLRVSAEKPLSIPVSTFNLDAMTPAGTEAHVFPSALEILIIRARILIASAPLAGVRLFMSLVAYDQSVCIL
jgi:hypothetical protein